ncbi:chaperone protein DnaJ-like isoform X3 [Zingiber officinale]|nr:chaperone protein DnaJ-like isoform X3 [Zingiber officinale]
MDASPAGSDAAASSSCYYSLLGIRRDAYHSEIRAAYRRLALRWHPDRWAKESAAASCEAKRRFQRIQEAYSVLSDTSKRAIYDAGLYDPLDDDDQVLPKRKYGIPSKNVVFFTLIFGWDAQGFADFMQEIMATMERLKPE